MAQKFTPTPEPSNIGTWHPVYREDGTVKSAIFVPIEPICPECRGLNGGHQRPPRRKR